MAGVVLLLLLFFNLIQSESAFILHYKITSECPCFFPLFFQTDVFESDCDEGVYR